MRTVALLAAILALPGWVLADEPQSVESITPATNATQPDFTTSGKYDTSVYHLKHTHARHIIPVVKQTIVKRLSAEAAGQPQASSSVVSVMFMPTTSDDTLVAVCSRDHAALVKEAIEACDVEKQYAVKVQLFEVSPNGEAAPAGETAVFVGREGAVQCKTSNNGIVTVNLKVDDGTTVAAAAVNKTEEEEVTEAADCCGPSCHSGNGVCLGSLAKGFPLDSNGKAFPLNIATSSRCGASCEKCTGSCTREQCHNEKCNAEACNTGKCDSEKCHAGTCTGETCTSSDCAACPKCAAAHQRAEASEKCDGSCCQHGALTALDARNLCQAILNLLAQSDEHTQNEHCDSNASDDAAPAQETKPAPGPRLEVNYDFIIAPATPSEAATEKAKPELGCPACPPTSAEALPRTISTTGNCCDNSPVPSVTEEAGHEHLFVIRPHSHDDGFLYEGAKPSPETPAPGLSNDDDRAVIRVSDTNDCKCDAPSASRTNEFGKECQDPSAEPPALLTLSRHNNQPANFGIVILPQWQTELAKIYQGRCLSEIFDSQNGQDVGARVGRLLAEIPKPGFENDGDNAHHRNVIVVDLPDRIRVFASPSEPKHVAAPACPSCPNCREQFHVFLEEVFSGSQALEEISQVGHTQNEASEPARELPSVPPSKLETTVVTYPLRDLVLLDDQERPVFETCTMIDHIQAAVEPNSWWHPSVSIQLDQQSMNLVVRQTPEVHKKIAAHLRDLRRLQVKQLCNLIERLSTDSETSD